jgi:hypothetical protein
VTHSILCLRLMSTAVAPHHLAAPLSGGHRDAGRLRVPAPRHGLHRRRLVDAPVRRGAKATATKRGSRSLRQLNPMALVEAKPGGKSTSIAGAHHMFLIVSMASSRPSTRARSMRASARSLSPAPATSPSRASAASSSVATAT